LNKVKQISHFSIIVPVYNGADTLDDCLTALVDQDYPPDQYEIIVVNDGSTDNTAEIASRYPVRLINLETNQGRVIARNTGAKAARYATLVFNDVRICPNETLLADISRCHYQPLMPDVKVYDGSKWGFPRFFYLLRSKIYAPYYPLSEVGEDFEITHKNFDKIPKGAGLFVSDQTLWLASQPETIDKSTNDDTRILRKIVEHRPILRTTAVSVKYKQRTELKDVVIHLFERGPRFADYYLHPGGRYYVPYLVVWLLLGLIILSTVLWPPIGILGGASLLLLGLVISASYLSQTPADVVVVAVCLPVILSAFGLGILKWQIIKLIKRFTPQSHAPGKLK